MTVQIVKNTNWSKTYLAYLACFGTNPRFLFQNSIDDTVSYLFEKILQKETVDIVGPKYFLNSSSHLGDVILKVRSMKRRFEVNFR